MKINRRPRDHNFFHTSLVSRGIYRALQQSKITEYSVMYYLFGPGNDIVIMDLFHVRVYFLNKISYFGTRLVFKTLPIYHCLYMNGGIFEGCMCAEYLNSKWSD